MIDLDVLTSALWKGKEKELADKFLERVRAGKFEVHTPYILLELINKWKHKTLIDKISDFYKLYSAEIITVEKLSEEIQKAKLDYEILSEGLTKITEKADDSDLVLISSIFELDCLVTLNRKHLRNKKEQISEFLSRNKLKPVEVVLPNEI